MFSFELTVRDGASIVFDAHTSETILDAAARAHILLLSGCREGVCGACRVTCSDGRAVMDPTVDSAQTNADRGTGKPSLMLFSGVDELEIAPAIRLSQHRFFDRVPAYRANTDVDTREGQMQ